MKIASLKQKELMQVLNKIWKFVRPQLLLITTLIGVALGIIIGIALRSIKCPPGAPERVDGCKILDQDIFYLEFPGVLLINLLKMVILPLIMTSLIASLCRMSSQVSGKMGGITILVFLITTIISVLIATLLSLTIQPGKRVKHVNSTGEPEESRTLETILDIFRNLCPRSLVEAAFMTATTVLNKVEKTYTEVVTNGTHNFTIERIVNVTVPTVTYKDGMNALGIIAFSLAFGAILSLAGPKASVLRDLNDVIMDVIMVMVKLVLWYSPIGILFLLLAKMVEIEDLASLWEGLGMYIVADAVASLIHMFVILPILTMLVIRRNPFKYYYYFLQAIVTGFATASSGATLAVSFHCAEDKAHVDPRICRFVLPMGATVHMDGTAIYEMCSALFLAQLTGTPLNAGKVIAAGIMSGLAAISSAGIPQGAIINLVMVLSVIGVPTNEIRILYATDWLLDRIRTAINVFGDCLCCVVLQKFMLEDLRRLDDSDSKFDLKRASVESIPLSITIGSEKMRHLS